MPIASDPIGGYAFGARQKKKRTANSTRSISYIAQRLMGIDKRGNVVKHDTKARNAPQWCGQRANNLEVPHAAIDNHTCLRTIPVQLRREASAIARHYEIVLIPRDQ